MPAASDGPELLCDERSEPLSIAKFSLKTRVRIASDLGPSMSHFPNGRFATVIEVDCRAGKDTQYGLDIDGAGRHWWYYEHQLTFAQEFVRAEVIAMDWPEYI